MPISLHTGYLARLCLTLAAAMAASALPWRFGQCFGEKDADEEFSEADVLSAVEFDTSGNYLATGDKGGRIVVFERQSASKVCRPWMLASSSVDCISKRMFGKRTACQPRPNRSRRLVCV